MMDRFRSWPAVATCLALMACGRGDAPSGLDYLYRPPVGRFYQVSSYDTTGGNRDRLEIARGDSAVLLDVDGPGVIQRIWITVSSGDPHYLRRIALKMYWDGEPEASVLVPLGDFFGNGFDKRHYTSLVMGVSSGGFYSYLPMPFRRHARVVVENGTGQDIDAFYYHIGLVRVANLPRRVQTLHATWHRDIRTSTPDPHVVLDAHGRGTFVGMSLNAESYRDVLDFLEGDEVFEVDGEWRGQGTGTEDYFNSGWYFQTGTFDAPYHGLILKDEQRGRIAAYRWHIPDPVRFDDSLRITLEHGHANEEVADYATVAYWYQAEPHAPFQALPAAAQRRTLGVKIPPGAVLLDSMQVERDGSVTALTLSVDRADRYEVFAYPVGGPDVAVGLMQMSGATTKRIDVFAEDAGTVLAPVSLGEIAGRGTVQIEVLGDTVPLPAAVELRPLRRWADTWYVVGPFPNPRVLETEYSPAIDSVYGPESDPALGTTYRSPLGDTLRWKLVSADPDGMVRLNAEFEPNDWVAAYAQSFLYAPAASDVTLLLGADDAHALWVNGERVSTRQGRHVSRSDEIEVQVRVRRGWNRVLLEVADLDGGWAFQMRAADPDGTYRWAARPGP